MHPDRPSLTAAAVSFGRGMVSKDPSGPCFDPLAVELLPPPFRQLLQLVENSGELRRELDSLFRVLTGGLLDHLELRTALIDEALREAVAGGFRQVVILGAGLDSRAWRMRELSSCTVWEVDHPSTQAWKQAQVQHRVPLARSLQFVPVDFERVSVAEALVHTFHDEGQRTFWIWEGVIPYLRPAAIDATLQAISERSARGSRIALTWVTPDLITRSSLRLLAYPFFKLIREPLRGVMGREAMAAMVISAGFRVLSDELPADAGPRFGRPGSRRWVSPSERVMIAQRQ